MLPHRTARLADNINEIIKAYGDDTDAWPANMFGYALAEACTVSIEAADSADDFHKALAGGWESAGATYMKRYRNLYSLLPRDVLDTWNLAYDATRPEPDVVHPEKPDDPEA